MLDFYRYYDKSNELFGYNKKDLIMPDKIWRFYCDHMEDLTDEENKRKYPDYMKQIVKMPEISYRYTKEKLTGRWPEAEKYIIKEPQYAVEYTIYVINRDKHPYRDKMDRWTEAEPNILAGPVDYIWNYIQLVIKDEWPEAEETLRKSPSIWSWYQSSFILDHWN